MADNVHLGVSESPTDALVVEKAGRAERWRARRKHEAASYSVRMAEIASEAGVVVETVYRIFGSKAALFRAAVEALLAGGARVDPGAAAAGAAGSARRTSSYQSWPHSARPAPG